MRGLKLLRVTPEQAASHYAEHEGKPFYPGLVEFITSGPTVAMVLEGPGAVATVRTMMGATDPLNSAPGTIRGDLALELGENVVHGSDSVDVGRARDRDLLHGRRTGVTSIAAALALGPIALASRSPQRRMILEQAGVVFHRGRVELPRAGPAGVYRPRSWCALHARGKARGGRADRPGGGAGSGHGGGARRRDHGKAARLALRPQGTCAGSPVREHRVHSGLYLRRGVRAIDAVETTTVTFADARRADVRWYLDTDEWVDRAGGYAIQGRGAALVTAIDGDYLNVVGLPLRALLEAMRRRRA